MSAETPLLVRTFKVGRYTVTMSFPRAVPGKPASVACEWQPTLPVLSKRELYEYKQARDAAIQEFLRLARNN
jgi:hypothetical protein